MISTSIWYRPGLVCLALGIFGCEVPADVADGHNSRLRDVLARTDVEQSELLALARRRGPCATQATPFIGAREPLSLVHAVDLNLARMGHDAMVAAQYTLEQGVVRAVPCADVLVGTDHGPDPRQWMHSCPGAIDDEFTVRHVAGLPTLAAWLPQERLLLVHASLGPESHVNGIAMVAAPLVNAGSSCESELDAWCQRCQTGEEAGCEPLFGPGTSNVGCRSLDAAWFEPEPASPRWRKVYCLWRSTVAHPSVRFRLLKEGCWRPDIDVVDITTLAEAFPLGHSSCDVSTSWWLQLERIGVTVAVPWDQTASPYAPFPIDTCARFMADVACRACTPDPEARCTSPFEQSGSAVSACAMLRRSDPHGLNGFGALCAFEYGVDACVNLYDECFVPRFGFDLQSFEQLVAAMPGFFDPDRADACFQQYDACMNGNPLPDVDVERPVPTAPRDTQDDSTAKEDAKCPQ